MFNFGGGGGFGSSQAQPSAFGTTPTTPAFGATTPFGAQPSPFGASQPAFGASQPAFGMSSPAFGASSASAFGSSAFGARPAAPAFGSFGQASASSPFGSTMPAFGASAPAFGATSAPAFGVSSAPAFGAASAPAFGAASAPAFGAPAFGASSSPFGGLSTSFGSSAPAFGQQPASAPSLFGNTFGASSAAAFGAASAPAFGGPGSPFGGQAGAQATGTRVAPYQKQVERDTSTTGANQTVNFMSISAMPAYSTKSVEELRCEDYQAGVKAGGNPTGGLGAPAFGSTFTGASSAASVFGSSPFRTPSSAATGSTFAFGSSSSSPFGGSSSPAFSGGVFGASSTSPFGATSAPAFGSTLTPSNPFGATTSPFGVTSSAQTPSPAPAFGATGSIFGSTPSPQSSAFGAPFSGGSVFGAQSAPSLFGGQSAPSLFGQPSSAASTFGTATGAFSFNTQKPAFGASSGGLFGAQSAPGMFSSSGFGLATTPTSTPFGTTTSTPGMFGSQTTSGFGAAAPFGAPATPAQPPAVNQAPYGTLAPLPTVSLPIPENKVGISQRPSNRPASAVASRVSPLLRTQVPRSSPFTRVRPYTSPLFANKTPPPAHSGSSALSGPGMSTRSSSLGPGLSPQPILPTRENPHSLFIREMPPSTDSSMTSGLTPTKTSAGGWSPMGADELMMQAPTPSPRRTTFETPDPSATPSAPPTNGTTPPNGTHAPHPTPSNGKAPSDTTPSAPSIFPTLGNLAAQGYTMSPSRTQLQAMYDADLDSLASVHGFTVARSGYGEIRWLGPVDVRGLDLSEVVSIGKGEASLYLNQSDKPPVGEGLNTRAEVTLEQVYKMDKTTNQPVKEGPSVIQYEKRLRKHCASIDAKFIAYKPQGGFWKFEVAHWSRYAMPDLSDEEDHDNSQLMDEDMGPTHQREEAGGPSTSSAGERAFGNASTRAGVL